MTRGFADQLLVAAPTEPVTDPEDASNSSGPTGRARTEADIVTLLTKLMWCVALAMPPCQSLVSCDVLDSCPCIVVVPACALSSRVDLFLLCEWRCFCVREGEVSSSVVCSCDCVVVW